MLLFHYPEYRSSIVRTNLIVSPHAVDSTVIAAKHPRKMECSLLDVIVTKHANLMLTYL